MTYRVPLTMSRSRKKPAHVDPTNRTMKPIARRRHRRRVNQEVRAGRVDFVEELIHPYEIMDPYDVCDYRGLCSGDCATCWRKEEQYKCRIK